MSYKDDFNKLYKECIKNYRCCDCIRCDDEGSLRFDNEHYRCILSKNNIGLYDIACENLTLDSKKNLVLITEINHKLFIKLYNDVFR